MANPEHIALARQGKDAWNAWARKDRGVVADFSGEDLTEISFAGFKFHTPVNFSGSEFVLGADFSGVEFYSRADFSMVKFRDSAVFDGATFHDMAGFSGSEIRLDAIFSGVKFSRPVHFTGAIFTGRAVFTDAAFSEFASFQDAAFLASDFSRSEFSDDVCFCNSKFRLDANFPKANFLGQADFSESEFLNSANFSGGIFSERANFSGVIFHGLANFSDRDFKHSADFRVKIFFQDPEFHNTSIHQGTKFGNIDDSFHGFESDGAEQSYRTLKLAMGQHQARTEEAAFAALELKSRRYRLKSEAKKMKFGWQRFLSWTERCGYCLWDKLSDSGRSFARPFGLYIASLIGSAALYVTLPICKVWFPIDVLNWGAGFRYAFLRQFSFAAALRGGSDRIKALEKNLFYLNEAGLPPWWVDLLNSAQSLTALVLIFLMGLGIRHKFRLR